MSTEAPGTIRILLADDHDFFREGMRGLLATVPGTNVVAEASSGKRRWRWRPSCSPMWC